MGNSIYRKPINSGRSTRGEKGGGGGGVKVAGKYPFGKSEI